MYLNPSCLENEQYSENKEKVLPYFLNKKHDFIDFRREVDELYDIYLSEVCGVLNTIHNNSYSKTQWEVMLKKFLYSYISIMYERFKNIEYLLMNYDCFETHCAANKGVDIYDTKDFFYDKILTDEYNLFIYARILDFFNKKYEKISFNIEGSRPEDITVSEKILRRVLFTISNFISIFNKKDKILLYKSYFDKFNLIKVFFFSKFNIYVVQSFKVAGKNTQKKNKYRDKLKSHLPHKTKFQKFLKSTLTDDFPIIFLEDFEKINYYIEKEFLSLCDINTVVTSMPWLEDDFFKIWITKNYHNTKIIGVQHGGNFGIYKYLDSDYLDIYFSNYYLSWGWANKGDKKIINYGSTKLINRSENKNKNRNKYKILFLMTSYNSSFRKFSSCRAKDVDYFLHQEKFLNNLSSDILPDIRIRPYNSKNKDSYIKLWQRYNSKVEVEGYDVKLVKSLEKCKLFICDNLNTSYLEALTINLPTILFWDSCVYSGEYKDEVKVYFKNLMDVGILHDTGKSAAQKVNDIYPNIDEWWYGPEVQSARKLFCEKFAKIPNDFIRDLDEVIDKAIVG